MGDYNSIYETVRRILTKQLEISPDLISEKTRIIEDLGADSLDVVELIMSIEENYNIIISNDDVSELSTIGQIVEFIEKQLKKCG